MEREAQAADLPLGLFPRQKFKRADALDLLEPFGVHRVAQVKIKIVHTAVGQLLVEHLLHILLRFQLPQRHLRCQIKRFPRIFFQRRADEFFRAAAVVRIRHVKIGNAPAHGLVHQRPGARVVDGGAARLQRGQAHTAQPQQRRAAVRIPVRTVFHNDSPFPFPTGAPRPCSIPAFSIRARRKKCNAGLFFSRFPLWTDGFSFVHFTMH